MQRNEATMQVGMMNDPSVDAVMEVQWAADNGFDFVDLTVEGPVASIERLDLAALRTVFQTTGLGVVGHTAWYLPFGSPVPELRAGAIDSVARLFEPLSGLGCTRITVHVDRGIGKFAYDDTLRWNAESFAQLAKLAQPYNMAVMIENVVNQLNTAKAFRTLLDAHPALLFHLDIGHANVKGHRVEEFLKAHAGKLAHVHISDNNLTADDHLPMGVGAIKWPAMLELLKRFGYDGTITLEVFTPDRTYLIENADRLRRLWLNEAV